MRIRIKICGITRSDDAAEAAAAGADAIGLVFHAPSPRRVGLDAALAITAALPPFVAAVALFVDPAPAAVREVLEAVRIDLLQFHGSEPAEFCRGFGVPYVKAMRMRPDFDLAAEAARYADARALLLDSYDERVAGGSGRSFGWRALPAGLRQPVILAGGLDPANVAEAVRIVRPYGVDVSSGVESSPGLKDRDKMRAFVRAVRSVEDR
jgi:phosphoribosylanthranilate isomerase